MGTFSGSGHFGEQSAVVRCRHQTSIHRRSRFIALPQGMDDGDAMIRVYG
jgi:hypothetical protein